MPARAAAHFASGCGKRGFRLQCFGQFALYEGVRHIPIRCKKARELLSLLVWEDGGPVSKRYAASMLWPESNLERARDCLYKTLSWLRSRPELCRTFGLSAIRESISISLENLSVDLMEFDRCYAGRGDIRCCRRAMELYSAPPFWRDCYDWSTEKQSLYELRYAEILHALSEYHRQQGGGLPQRNA